VTPSGAAFNTIRSHLLVDPTYKHVTYVRSEMKRISELGYFLIGRLNPYLFSTWLMLVGEPFSELQSWQILKQYTELLHLAVSHGLGEL